MSTYVMSDIWTDEELEEFTTGGDLDLSQDLSLLDDAENLRFAPLTMLEETTMTILITCMVISLNSIILKCYWYDKSATSTYFKAFAVIDMACVAVVLIRRLCVFIWPTTMIVDVFGSVATGLNFGLYNFGSLFLAIDRCLIVVFPYNFRELKGKLRVAKGVMIFCMGLLAVMASLLENLARTSFTTKVFIGLYFVALILQILAIVVLYTTVIAKILTSDRKMKSSRHIGNM